MKNFLHQAFAVVLTLTFVFGNVAGSIEAAFADEPPPASPAAPTEPEPNSSTAPAPSASLEPAASVVPEVTPAPEMQTQAMVEATAVGEETATPLKPRIADPLKQVADITGNHTVNEFSGNFEYSYPIPLPPGRNGLIPELSLGYNSSDRDIDSPVGYGWSLSLPSIQRFTRSGIENLYVERNFTSPFAGGSGELVAETVDANGYGTYVPKVVSGKYKHEFLADKSWRVTDSKGTVYLFGTTADGRIQNETGTRIHSWYLVSVTDTNGNVIVYDYKKAGNNLYPSRIRWGSEVTPFEVRFEPYYSGTIQVPDVLPSQSRGFEVIEKMDLLDRIEILAPNTTDKLVYELSYFPKTTFAFFQIDYLKQIQRIGIAGGQQTTDNPTVFQYASYDGSRSFPVQLPAQVANEGIYKYYSDYDNALQWVYGDYNGDGWTDLAKDTFEHNSYSGITNVAEEAYLSQGNGAWTHYVNPNPDQFWWTAYYMPGTPWVTSPIFIDFDGDGEATNCRKETYTVGQQGSYPGINVRTFKCAAGENGTFYHAGSSGEFQLMDVNGDGLQDAFKPSNNGETGGGGYTFVNNGSTLVQSPIWPFSASPSLPWYDRGALVGDINGDGLDDVVYRYQRSIAPTGPFTKVMLAKNDGWVDATADISIPIATLLNDCSDISDCNFETDHNLYAHLIDMDRDGLPDLVYGKGKVHLNTGKGWSNEYSTITNWTDPINMEDEEVDSAYYNQFNDVNNDGILERFRHRVYGGHNEFYQNDRPQPPILTAITTPLKANITVEYTPASAYKNPDNSAANFELPIPHLTVSKLTVSGGQLPVSTTAYSYAGGKLYRPNIVKGVQKQEMAGFQTVTRTDPDNSKTITEFFQGLDTQNFAGKGNPVRQTVTGADGKLLAETRNALTVAERLTGKSYESLLSKTLSIAFNPNNVAENKATGKEYQYDVYGNITTETDYGEVTPVSGQPDFTDVGTDKLTTTIEYALSTAAHILSLPQRSETKDQNNVTVAEQKVSYDGQIYGTAPIEGNPTKNETLRLAGQYVSTQTAYNSYGLPTAITNARNYTTTITYDSQNLHPATVTNPKNQATSYTYNYLFGTPAQITDPNNLKMKYTYDGLGRLTQTEISDPANPTQFLTQTTYAYDLAAAPVSITTTAFPNNNDTGGNPIQITAKTYLDGLGRTIQTRTEWEGSNNYLVAGTVYDNRGNVKKTLLPQFGTGTAFDASFNETKPGSANTYDALNRNTSVATPYGASTATTTIGYDRWSKTITDARGFKKDFVTDARGNLIQVKEYLTAGAGASPAGTTTYTYDALKNLTKITDASGNIKNLTYDLLGRKLTENDFHASADSTFSQWTYTYDANGNLTSVTDTKSQTTNFTYDELDRPLTEDFTGQTGTEVTYAYDTAPNGKGRPTSITTKQNNQPVITKAFEYDLLGRVTKETRSINSINYVTQTEYDLAGNPKRIIYPDAGHTEALYAYNNAGQLEKVQKKSGATTTDLVTNFDYAPTGAPLTIAYANGVTTTHTYDINYLYYLTKKVTTKGTTKLQDIAYSFDSTGNISRITDVSATEAAKTLDYAYDGLSRLLTATATNAANGQNYAQTFAYDIIGNIMNKSDVGAYTYGQTNYASPHAVTAAGGKTYIYDNNGNLSGDGTWTHAWDYKDRLLESTEQGSGNTDHVKYNYDEGGTRITKENTTSGKKTTYVSDLLDIEAGTEKLAFFANSLKLATLEQVAAPSGSECTVPASGDWTVTANCTISSFKTASGNVTVNAGVTLTIAPTGVLEINLNAKKLLVKNTGKVLVQQGGAIAQTGRLSPLPGGTTGGLIFHHADHLSGASVDTDTAGNVLQLTDYYPYGDSRIEETSATFHNDYTYTGKERDEDTALLYYEARYYDSHIGRFISLDLWGGDINDPQSFNKYAYVRNNPLKYRDPDGRKYWGFSNEEVAFYERVHLGQFIGPLSPDQSKKFQKYEIQRSMKQAQAKMRFDGLLFEALKSDDERSLENYEVNYDKILTQDDLKNFTDKDYYDHAMLLDQAAQEGNESATYLAMGISGGRLGKAEKRFSWLKNEGRTPEENVDNYFTKLKGGQGWIDKQGNLWVKSHTSHRGDTWKVFRANAKDSSKTSGNRASVNAAGHVVGP